MAPDKQGSAACRQGRSGHRGAELMLQRQVSGHGGANDVSAVVSPVAWSSGARPDLDSLDDEIDVVRYAIAVEVCNISRSVFTEDKGWRRKR